MWIAIHNQKLQTVTLFVPKSPPACYAVELDVSALEEI
jgi:hypothetical protein